MAVHGHASLCVYPVSRVESGSDDPDNLGHLGHFLEGQVHGPGLIHKLNYLDVTRISCTRSLQKQCWQLVSK